MVAVQDILQAPENIFGYALITDTLIYSIWLMLMFASVAVSPRFNRWTKADTSYLDTHAGEADDEKRPVTAASLAIVTFGSIFVSSVAIWVGGMLPEYGAVVTPPPGRSHRLLLGLVIAVTLLGKTPDRARWPR